MSCEYGKQRGYDYDYNRNSVDERAAEGQYLRHGVIHMPCIESKDHQPNGPVESELPHERDRSERGSPGAARRLEGSSPRR